jgi:hypothetical protein
MFPSRLRAVRWAALALAAFTACSRARRAADMPPPRAEFLVSSADSTFWVATTTGKLRVRGVPLILARYAGHFYELYTADDDFSFDDALLLGERLYSRDLSTGDSSVVFADTTVERIANAYAKSHPDERPLEPDQEGEAQPSTTATAEVDILEVFGPYVSYEYHVDVDLPGRRPWHSTRRGVVDLRSGKPSAVADLFGPAEARRLAATGRRAYEATRDSILRARGLLHGGDRRAADVLAHLQFDERSFTLSDVDGHPAVSFGVPGHGEGAAGNLVELDPLPVDSAPWWSDLRVGFAEPDSDGNDVWAGSAYTVRADYDTSGTIAQLSLTDSSRRRWPIATVSAPVRRIDWLDRPSQSDAERRALLKAFDQAATYDENARVASNVVRAPLSPLRLTSLSRFMAPNHLPRPVANASHQDRPRKPARNRRADDARACEQHAAGVRRRGVVDDGQVRGDLRVSSQPRTRRDRVDRSRRLSRADSPGRPGHHAVERQPRGPVVDGDRRPCRS